MRTRLLFLGSVLVLVGGACTGGGPIEDDAPGSAAVPAVRDVLLVQTHDGSVTIDTSAGALLAATGGVPSLDGTVLFSTEHAAGGTDLQAIDPVTGAVVGTRHLAPTLDVRVVSERGGAVALMEPLEDGVDAWTPVPRADTTIVVADPWSDELRRYRLEGNYEPEAFSIDEGRLFLIQYLPAEAPVAYRVTVLDLGTGRVHSVFGRFKTPPERMPGVRLSQVYDPVRAQLYTLYSNRTSGYGGATYGDVMPGASTTFVHVLNLRDGWAYCAGVPRAMWDGEARDQTMAVSPDGRMLYVVDTAEGLISTMNTGTMRTMRTERMAFGEEQGVLASAAIGGDGTTLYVGSSREPDQIFAVDTAALEISGQLPASGGVGGLGLSPDGARLYALVGDEIAAIDTGSGRAYLSFPISGVEAIVGVQGPASPG